ncbi:MAG: LptF/LptG family permease [Salinivirgaceae bacterium]|nr:LptF/LptG family permease [Salinivirgaceae bacterium]
MKKLDLYIIKKFLGTFVYALLLIIIIVIVFDVSEKIDDFIEKDAPLHAIIFDYYLNFIPYFANLFSALFTFISVIFFTSKLTSDSEIIAILSSGISFKRLLRPYIISAIILTIFSFILINWIIPPANQKRLEFEEVFIKNRFRNKDKNIHKQILPETFIYLDSYNNLYDIGYKFSMEKFENGKLKSKLISDYAQWDTTINKWKIVNYIIRDFDEGKETITNGRRIDTTINMFPKDFTRRVNVVEAMNYKQLDNFIAAETMVGSSNVTLWKIEKHKRFAYPFSTIILTLIGVCISSRKTRGGIGLNIGIGIFLAFTYIMFMQVSTVLATNANMNPFLAVWIPNITYGIIAIGLYFKAAK